MFRDSDTTSRQFSERTNELLSDANVAIEVAERGDDAAQGMNEELEGLLVDLFGLQDAPGDAVYKLMNRGLDSDVIGLELNVEWVPDGESMVAVLGDRIHDVMTLQPRFDKEKAEAAVRRGIVTEAELAQCLQPIAHPSVVRYRFGQQDETLKKLPAGEGRVKPLDLPKGLKLQWGERG